MRRELTTKIGTSRNSPSNNKTNSYYTRTRSPQVDKTRSGPTCYASESSSEDDYLDKDYVTGHVESNTVPDILPIPS